MASFRRESDLDTFIRKGARTRHVRMQEEVGNKGAAFSNADEACDVVPAIFTRYLEVANLDEIDGFYYARVRRDRGSRWHSVEGDPERAFH